MNTTTSTCRDPGHCPGDDRLGRLLDGRISERDAAPLTDHVGDCEGCRDRLDALATAGAGPLPEAVRHIDQNTPPNDSAYWRAVGDIKNTLTTDFTPAHGEDRREAAREDSGSVASLKLDFLRPSDDPGRLGRIGGFEVNRVLGRGGMGVVLHAYDPCLHRDVALKILDPQLAGNEVARQRFCREARAAAAVTHDNLVAVHQVDEDADSGLPFLVMQLVNGESLEQRLRRAGRLSVTDAARFGAQAAAGLAAAHATGLIHRDIKPGNMLIEAGTDKLKLTDFGLARAAEDLKLTRTGFVAGTPLYMAPEQARGDDVDARADLFSLGSVLYEMLAGRPAFDGRTPLAVLKRVADEPHDPLRKLHPEVPIGLEEIVDRLLEKEPGDRFAGADEVAAALSVELAHLQPGLAGSHPEVACGGARHSTWMSRRRQMHFCRKQMAKMAGFFVLGSAVGGLGGWSLAPRTADPAAVASADAGPKPLEVLPAGAGAVWSVATTDDGKTLATGLESGRVSFWDLSSTPPRLTVTLPGHKGPVWAADFTADGKRLVTASDDGSIIVWDAKTGKLLKNLVVGRSIRSAAVSPSGNWVVAGDRFGMVAVFDLTNDSLVVEYRQDAVINGVAFSPDELTVASVGTDSSVWLWEIAANRKRFTLAGHGGPVYGVSFSRDGQRLATASWDQSVIVWDLNSGASVRKIAAHEEGVWDVEFDPSGRHLATAGQDGTAKLWDAASGELLAAFGNHRGTVHALRFGHDGDQLVTGGRDGAVRLWDAKAAGQ